MKRVKLASGIELDCIDEGPESAPALIFLHGFPESHRTWRHQVAHLKDRFRCVAPDQRGYRGSSKPPEVSDYTPDKLIGDIFQLADALGIERFTILGHDWGGAIAWGTAIAGQMNGRVTRAVIANAPHPAIFQKLLYLNEHQRTSSQYMRGFRDTANDALVREQGLYGILAQEIRWDSGDKMEPEERAQLLEGLAGPRRGVRHAQLVPREPDRRAPARRALRASGGLDPAGATEPRDSHARAMGHGRPCPATREHRGNDRCGRRSHAGRGPRQRAFRDLGSA